MSSTPFCLGIPVVDDLPVEPGAYVLRTRTKHDVGTKIRDLQDRLSIHDLIKIYLIGYRPDKPIPVSRYFAEIHIDIDGAEKWERNFGYWNTGMFHTIATGVRGDGDDTQD